jgi:quinol monooxygenase YgiN
MQEDTMARTRIVREFIVPLALTALISAPSGALLIAQGAPGQPTSASAQQGMPDLVAGLKATPGCLGVELAKTQSGKQVIFAWFENKQALLKWYYSPTHQTVMKMLAPDAKSGRPPLNSIADNSGPILAIASLTYADTAQVTAVKMPISQIAIELYAPLPGGLAVGGRFAPASVKVAELLEAPSDAPAGATTAR